MYRICSVGASRPIERQLPALRMLPFNLSNLCKDTDFVTPNFGSDLEAHICGHRRLLSISSLEADICGPQTSDVSACGQRLPGYPPDNVASLRVQEGKCH
jgi:hypothetical protein